MNLEPQSSGGASVCTTYGCGVEERRTRIGRAERNPSKKIAILELGGFRYRLATGRIRVTRILREAQLDHSRRRRLLLSLSFLRPITLSAPTCCHKAARTTRSFNTSTTSWASPRQVKRKGRGEASSFSTSICSPKNSSIGNA